MRAGTYSRKLTTGGGSAWSVEAADTEAQRLRRRAEQASRQLLALLKAFHHHGQGELALARKRVRARP